MKAIVFTEYGSTDVLRLKEVPTPAPNDDEVLVKIHAASINDWDWAFMHGEPFFTRFFTGFLKPKPTIQIPGCDIAGHIEAVGKNVVGFQAGDNVYGDLCQSGFGAFAEYVCAPETALALMPFSEAVQMTSSSSPQPKVNSRAVRPRTSFAGSMASLKERNR